MNDALRTLLDTAATDPLLAYSLLAAALLAVVSLGTGLVRLDGLALVRPRTLLRVAGAVLAAFLLVVAATVASPEGLGNGAAEGTAVAADGAGPAPVQAVDTAAAAAAAAADAAATAAEPATAAPAAPATDGTTTPGEGAATGAALPTVAPAREGGPATEASAASGTEGADVAPRVEPWWTGALRGLSRFPLYVVTLAYGPTVGLVAAALFAGFESSTRLPGWPEAILALELVVLGWLAIYPSPRQHRLAGPFNALLAYALAWGTAGLALLEARTGAVTAAALWQQHRDTALGIVASAVLLALLSPATYRSAFPSSRIAPVERVRPARSLVLTVVEERPERVDVTLTQPDLPRVLLRRGRDRALEPLPELPDVDD